MTRKSILFTLVALIALILVPLGQGNYIIYVLTSWLVFSIAAMGLNLTLGYAGQISLAQAAFMGIGAYIAALITLAGYHWVLGWLAAMGGTFVIGLLLGYPALRVQHHFLAFVTLAFNTLVFLVLRNEDWLTGGSHGLVGMPRPNFFGLSTGTNLEFYYFTLVLFVISGAIFYWIVNSPWGRAFKALRENPVRAESLGVDTRRITLLAFAIGSAFGGGAGAIMSPLVQFIEPGSFAFIHSLKILLMVVVGGAGFFFGPILGAAVVILLPEFLRFTEGYYLMIYASLVIVLMIYSPSGLIGAGQKLYARLRPGRETRKDMEKGAQL
ncbi:branched-chain amino acid ABC transporter permease [Sinisalibacter lacisalsi]|uniref:Branched-chain amino acid ABC transporter permease n=1 Tax=Sinisalibacter lacisalsi TaxID=1526570 RepID=A0ABQ1QFQ4_9RHOB|nr:branched-chain amino acid ABC transporter permease [Sinisalibacter lacisalsi]GGD25214.1 branched-chain amino acid ABC transporter permease [Sinisalibacter lacisalsi]